MNRIALCIPTYNCPAYIFSLLNYLQKNNSGCFSEIVICDNSEGADTHSIVSQFSGILNITYKKNENNIGPYENLIKCFNLASKEYVFYCADDDEPNIEQVIHGYNLIESNPSVSAVYGIIESIDKSRSNDAIKQIDTDANIILQQDFYGLINYVTKNYYTPETAIIRRSAIKSITNNQESFYLFYRILGAACQTGDIIFTPLRFYRSILRHFAGEQRDRYTVKYAKEISEWGQYYFGLLYILSLSEKFLDENHRDETKSLIEQCREVYLHYISYVSENLNHLGKEEGAILRSIAARDKNLIVS